MTPYLASDNRTLNFSSDRPGGIGDVDVYRSTRLDDSWRNWSTPENLGSPINRAGRTTFYTEDASGTRAYFSWSATAGEQADIYRAKIKSKRAVALVRGRVLDQAGKPIEARVYYTASSQASRDSSLGSANSNPTTGEYQLVLPAGGSYVLFANKEGYFVTTVTLDLGSLATYQTFDRDLILTKAEAGTSVSLHNILFETDKSTLLPSSFGQLDQVVEFLGRYPKTEILVRGHTDSTGSEVHNLELSRSRAEAVKRYLTDKGIGAARIRTEGKGAEQPIAPNSTQEGKAANRRVEFVIEKSE
jgi:outer membrane protein OmpA-like peptidoglycan-associated protein